MPDEPLSDAQLLLLTDDVLRAVMANFPSDTRFVFYAHFPADRNAVRSTNVDAGDLPGLIVQIEAMAVRGEVAGA